MNCYSREQIEAAAIHGKLFTYTLIETKDIA
jgi:hypothetical protein